MQVYTENTTCLNERGQTKVTKFSMDGDTILGGEM